MACSPFFNAVFCHDARFSCPAASTCSSDIDSQESKCVASDGSVIGDAAMSVDAMAVAEFRNYGSCCFVRMLVFLCILVLFVTDKSLCD